MCVASTGGDLLGMIKNDYSTTCLWRIITLPKLMIFVMSHNPFANFSQGLIHPQMAQISAMRKEN
jgi:hypothetical protein